MKFEYEGKQLEVTISAGIASSEEHLNTVSLFEAADKALYASKGNGRNQVRVTTSAETPVTLEELGSSTPAPKTSTPVPSPEP